MPNVQIKGVPEQAHAVLRRRAAAAHQSLQEYLLSRIIADTSRPTLDEVLDRAAAGADGRFSFDDVVTAVQDDRGRR